MHFLGIIVGCFSLQTFLFDECDEFYGRNLECGFKDKTVASWNIGMQN